MELQSKAGITGPVRRLRQTPLQCALMIYDVAIVGGGPAGSACASFCAANGLRTIVLEREKFPREKVCGDCINPACWPVLRRLGVEQQVRGALHGVLDFVEFIDRRGESVRIELPRGSNGEIAIKRSLLDLILLERAREGGAEVCDGTIVHALARSDVAWEINTGGESISARFVVAADGRNSTVARVLGLLPRLRPERVALQAHVPLPLGFGNRVVLQLLRGGYSGQAPVNERELNVCLVGRPATLPGLRQWAAKHFRLAPEQQWRTVTPLTRASIPAAHKNLFLIGDAARVVEPFTGEGISYALNTGEIAAEMIHRLHRGASPLVMRQEFRRACAAMYRGRLWINALARIAVVSPRMGSLLFELARLQPALLRVLTRRIVR
jgi:menaquinone-9 beta-reductase